MDSVRKIFFPVFVFVWSLVCDAAEITWDGGGGDSSWSTAANWVGDVVPGPGDDVRLDNSIVPGSYFVYLPPGNVAIVVNRLIISPVDGNTIELVNPVTNISPSALTATGSGDAIILNTGAILKNSSGASSGTPVGVTTSNFFRINNGGRYIHNCERAHTTTLVARLSTAPGTEFGVFEFDVPTAAFTFSLSGRTYGSLVFSSSAFGSAVTYLSGGSSVSTINGDLVINSRVLLTLDYSRDVIINGSLVQRASSTFNLSNSTGSNLYHIRGDLVSSGTITETGTGLPQLYLDGSVRQNISMIGSITNSVTLTMNNPAGATLLSGLSIPFALLLTTGIIKTSPAFLLTLADNATCTGGSSNSFVDGPMRKIGDDDFVFPIGEGLEYGPIGISGGGDPRDEFIGRYIRSNPQLEFGSQLENPPIDHMSALEWWSLERGLGTSSKKITLFARGYSDATLTSRLLVIRWDGNLWKNEGRSSSTGLAVGTVSSEVVSAFQAPGLATAFTLGSDAPYPVNPLPIGILSFDVMRVGEEEAELHWTIGDDYPPFSEFEIQKSEAGNAFRGIAKLNVLPACTSYHYRDRHLRPGMSLYRIRIDSADDARRPNFSKTVAVWSRGESLRLIKATSPVFHSALRVSLYSPRKDKLEFVVADIQGRLYSRQTSIVEKGENTIDLALQGLPRGVIVLYAVNILGRSNVLMLPVLR
jgi:hypothetical protein